VLCSTRRNHHVRTLCVLVYPKPVFFSFDDPFPFPFFHTVCVHIPFLNSASTHETNRVVSVTAKLSYACSLVHIVLLLWWNSAEYWRIIHRSQRFLTALIWPWCRALVQQRTVPEHCYSQRWLSSCILRHNLPFKAYHLTSSASEVYDLVGPDKADTSAKQCKVQSRLCLQRCQRHPRSVTEDTQHCKKIATAPTPRQHFQSACWCRPVWYIYSYWESHLQLKAIRCKTFPLNIHQLFTFIRK
jgi:hypothetical protein